MNNRYSCRAKRKNCRELPKEKWWVEGCYAYMQPYHYIMPKDNFDSWIEIDEKTLCACTGLKDMNGKLIWENDIVIINGWIGKVMWSSNDTAYIVLPNDDIKNETYCLGYWVNEYNVEVIGNEIDNPELLEVGE